MVRVTTLDDVRAALGLRHFDAVGAQSRMAPQPRTVRVVGAPGSPPRQASVLLVLYPAADGMAFPLMQRPQHDHDVHSGQISLPGGVREPGETALDNALREAREEVGLDQTVMVLGELTALYIAPSRFDVQPFVGWVPVRPQWRPDPAEVAAIVECRLDWLLDDTRKGEADWTVGGMPLRVPWYTIGDHQVWGATAIILSELEHRLRQVLGAALP
jgi:8-oxo-dGTP pyrophosphatase MutT (NUDIX family)